ncbi:hypothetical protein B0H14DRAFT_2733177 [Mycena olivaceomarginata]|nr:hypothetical protein B0H14DRAFT_2733177 [Mycena olivaceomarginata]
MTQRSASTMPWVSRWSSMNPKLRLHFLLLASARITASQTGARAEKTCCFPLSVSSISLTLLINSQIDSMVRTHYSQVAHSGSISVFDSLPSVFFHRE